MASRNCSNAGAWFHLGRWWWVILLTLPVLIGGALELSILLGEPAPKLPALASPLALPIVLVWIFFLGGPLQYEFGWQGYLFETLQGRMASDYAAIFAGAVWGLWHPP
jgi:membrane protease YdiL (CAAX protease family)